MQKTTIVILSILLICCTEAFSQKDPVRKGGYRNFVDFKNNTPSFKSEFSFIKIEDPEIPEFYNVKAHKIKRKIINYGIWGIYDGKYFYLNVTRLIMARGYIRIDTLRNYSYFKGIPMMSVSQKNRLYNSSYYFGLPGEIVTGLKINSENKNNIHYILDFRLGVIHLLTKEYLLTLLQPYSDLLYRFQQEDENESIGVLLYYIDLLNQE